jgi:hypothetical protein
VTTLRPAILGTFVADSKISYSWQDVGTVEEARSGQWWWWSWSQRWRIGCFCQLPPHVCSRWLREGGQPALRWVQAGECAQAVKNTHRPLATPSLPHPSLPRSLAPSCVHMGGRAFTSQNTSHTLESALLRHKASLWEGRELCRFMDITFHSTPFFFSRAHTHE